MPGGDAAEGMRDFTEEERVRDCCFWLAGGGKNWQYLRMLENPDSLIARVRKLAEERTALWERASKLAEEVRLRPQRGKPEGVAAAAAGWPARGMPGVKEGR